ncbi:F-box protein [Tripterygium wilfordii]|uniref:F-box protein n=1 Tax=Tripterygium wilfordii TaxID=458696 RepID=A0A7J7CAI3_TRIWF|nr:F-box protein [Tripterygium wilfordii]
MMMMRAFHPCQKKFEDFRLVRTDRKFEEFDWDQIHSIGDDEIFVGDNSNSMCVDASNFPGCMPNTIYYTGDSEEPHDWGVFDLKDGIITRHYCGDQIQREGLPPPVWIVPTLGYRDI